MARICICLAYSFNLFCLLVIAFPLYIRLDPVVALASGQVEERKT